MSQIYESFFDEPNDIFKQAVRSFGGPFVYKHIEEVTDAVKVKNGPKKNNNLRLIAFPLDSNNFRESKCFAIFTTAVNSAGPYKKPNIYNGKLQIKTKNYSQFPHVNGGGYHPMYIPEQEREMYRNKLMQSLATMLTGLTEKRTEELLSRFQ